MDHPKDYSLFGLRLPGTSQSLLESFEESCTHLGHAFGCLAEKTLEGDHRNPSISNRTLRLNSFTDCQCGFACNMLVCENNVHKYVDWIGFIYIYVICV